MIVFEMAGASAGDAVLGDLTFLDDSVDFIVEYIPDLVVGADVVVGGGAVPKHSSWPTVNVERCVLPFCWSTLN